MFHYRGHQDHKESVGILDIQEQEQVGIRGYLVILDLVAILASVAIAVFQVIQVYPVLVGTRGIRVYPGFLATQVALVLVVILAKVVRRALVVILETVESLATQVVAGYQAILVTLEHQDTPDSAAFQDTLGTLVSREIAAIRDRGSLATQEHRVIRVIRESLDSRVTQVVKAVLAILVLVALLGILVILVYRAIQGQMALAGIQDFLVTLVPVVIAAYLAIRGKAVTQDGVG
jgi:hypothetical protein